MNQCRQVLQYVQQFGSITSEEARTAFGCARLASRISDLKQRGYEVQRVMESGKNRYGEPVSYARYYIKNPPLAVAEPTTDEGGNT